MTNYFPKDEQILSWDPENMEQYWQQCQRFDCYTARPLMDSSLCEIKSQQSFADFILDDCLVDNSNIQDSVE